MAASEWLHRLETERDEGPYACPQGECDRIFESVAGLRGHLRAVHNDQVTTRSNGEAGNYPCPDCGEVFRKAQGRGAHRARKHGYRSTNSHPNRANGAKAQGRVVAVEPVQEIQESRNRVIARFYVPVAVLGLIEFAEAQGARPQIRPREDGSFELVVEAS